MYVNALGKFAIWSSMTIMLGNISKKICHSNTVEYGVILRNNIFLQLCCLYDKL